MSIFSRRGENRSSKGDTTIHVMGIVVLTFIVVGLLFAASSGLFPWMTADTESTICYSKVMRYCQDYESSGLYGYGIAPAWETGCGYERSPTKEECQRLFMDDEEKYPWSPYVGAADCRNKCEAMNYLSGVCRQVVIGTSIPDSGGGDGGGEAVPADPSANIIVSVDEANIVDTNKLSLGTQITNYRILSFPTDTAQQELLRDANIKLVRFFVHWKSRDGTLMVRPCDSWNNNAMDCNNWKWEPIDNFVEAVYEAGAEPLIAIMHSGSGGIEAPPGMTTDADGLPNKDQYAAYARAFVKHFNDKGDPWSKVRYYEIINEVQFYITSGGWSNVNYGRLDKYMALYKTAREQMKAENPDLTITFDFVTFYKVLDHWLDSGGVEVDSLNFHKYDAYSINQYTDAQVLERAENAFFGQWPLGRSVKDSQTLYQERRGKLLPITNSEGNMNSHWAPTDPRIVQMIGACWDALVIRQAIINGLSYTTHFTWAAGLNYEQTYNSYGFGLINSDNDEPWYPYYVYKMIGPNLAVGDPIVGSSSTSDNLRTLAWVHGGELQILLIHKSTGTTTVSIGGLSGQVPYQKIDNTIPFTSPEIQQGTINAGDLITLNGYTVMLLGTPSEVTVSGCYVGEVTNYDDVCEPGYVCCCSELEDGTGPGPSVGECVAGQDCQIEIDEADSGYVEMYLSDILARPEFQGGAVILPNEVLQSGTTIILKILYEGGYVEKAVEVE